MTRSPYFKERSLAFVSYTNGCLKKKKKSKKINKIPIVLFGITVDLRYFNADLIEGHKCRQHKTGCVSV